ncbi:hypothetical protein [Nostoc sp. FACHB-110]|nr:hypothetical protein [Nostoc sp. FACHB-110]MBD2435696.1 hypothetical protein [Nostoc sp. FACHB-110]
MPQALYSPKFMLIEQLIQAAIAMSSVMIVNSSKSYLIDSLIFINI